MNFSFKTVGDRQLKVEVRTDKPMLVKVMYGNKQVANVELNGTLEKTVPLQATPKLLTVEGWVGEEREYYDSHKITDTFVAKRTIPLTKEW